MQSRQKVTHHARKNTVDARSKDKSDTQASQKDKNVLAAAFSVVSGQRTSKPLQRSIKCSGKAKKKT